MKKYTDQEWSTVFWSRVNVDGPVPSYRPDLGPCWIWTGSHTSGYGTMRRNGEVCYVHILIHVLAGLVIPDQWEIDHLCRVKDCLRPTHLEIVPAIVNKMRGVSPSSVNHQKTHCLNGHEFTAENTYSYPITSKKAGDRECRVCMRSRWMENYRKRKRLAAAS